MTCERRYDIAAVNLLQQAAANIEAERRRQYRAEMAEELREWLAANERPTDSDEAEGFADGWGAAIREVEQRLNWF